MIEWEPIENLESSPSSAGSRLTRGTLMGYPSTTTAGMPRPIERSDSPTPGLAGLRLSSETLGTGPSKTGPGPSEPILKGCRVGAPRATPERKERTTADLIVMS